jgi:hypothetical protein
MMGEQLGFDALLNAAATDNQWRKQERACAHLPGTMDEAVPFLRALIDRHHAAMLAGDAETVERLREEAHQLAVKLNDYEPGILADDDAPGCALDRLTRAQDGTVPLWGQSGSFIIECAGMRVRIAMDGLFGIPWHSSWMGFAAYAVDWDAPFLSETGYRSFLGVGGPLTPGHTPETFAAAVIAAHVRSELKGKLRKITSQWRPSD